MDRLLRAVGQRRGDVSRRPERFGGLYEDRHHAIAPASDTDMLRHLMEAKGVTQTQVSREAGIAKSTVSEVLAGKKPLSCRVIRCPGRLFKRRCRHLGGEKTP